MGLPMWNPLKANPSDEEASNKPPVNNPTATRNPPPANPYGSLLGSSSSGSSSTSASSSTASADDRTLRWERLHSLRNRLVDRMYRLEMDEMLNNTHGNNNPEDNENGEGSSGVTRDTQVTLPTPAASPIPVVTPSRPVPIPAGRPNQVSSAGSVSLDGPDAVRNWASLHHPGEISEAQGNSARTEGGHRNELQARREVRGEPRRRAEESRRILEAREARRRTTLDLLQSSQFQSHVPAQAQAAERQAVGRLASDGQIADSRGDALITLDEFLRESREPISDSDEAGPAPSGIPRSSSIPPINRLRAGDPSRLRWVNPARPEVLGGGRLRPDDVASSAGITVPQTLPAATWWPLPTPPPGHHMAPNETFDTFISHIRRIGHLQDAMLATIRSSNSTLALAAETAAGAPGTNSAGFPGDVSSTTPGPTTIGQGTPTSTTPSTATPARPAALSTTTSDTSVTSGTAPPSLNATEARLRAMQTRIDILTSEFSLLRSSWALSHVENQGFERSLRRLQEYIPSARRAERVRRGNRGGEVSLHYEDLHADAAAREVDLIPRNPWGDSDGERNRESMRMAAAWALGREGLTTTEVTGSTGVTAEGNRDAETSSVVPMVPGENTAEPFSVKERESQKELLAAKMEELTLRGMR
ncbi:hypothetical protein EV426DRAFT_573128 [Tirmania nivea]|nr:hypothetical protein EV426DRAFT_573128 [Tirmania nivea]